MKIIILLIQCIAYVLSDDTCALANVKDYKAWIADDYGRLLFPVFNEDALSVGAAHYPTSENRSAICSQVSGNLRNESIICEGSLDYTLIESLRQSKTNVTSFIVYNYNLDGVAPDALAVLFRKDLIQLTGYKYKAMGDVTSNEIGIGTRLSIELIPVTGYYGYIASGDVFSNELRVGWKFNGTVILTEANGSISVQANVSSIGDGGWRFTGHCTLYLLGYWTCPIEGTVEIDFLQSSIAFTGVLQSIQETDFSWKLTGKVIVKPLLIVWSIAVGITPSVNEHITIPEKAMENIKIEHLLFNNSYFMGDFDKNALQEISGLKTVTFLNSKLEDVPPLDSLLYNLKDLEAIYIDESSLPNFNMGATPSLPNLQLLSFKGSGPLQLNETSFSWLSKSKIQYLNLQDCNIYIATNVESVMVPISSTLRYLDLSFTSLTDETEITRMLTGLKITHLSLAGLELKVVPKTALKQVSNTLQFLTLRSNLFQKVPEENMFNMVLDFPLMLHLEELDLERCGINYIEAGAFDTLYGLKKLYLAYNYVENIQEGWRVLQPALVQIDLSWNGVSGEVELMKAFNLQPGNGLKNFSSLQSIDFSNSNMKYPEVMVSGVSSTTKQLSLCNMKLPNSQALVDLDLPNLENMDISGNPFILFGNQEFLNFLHRLNSLKNFYARNNKITSSFFTSIKEFCVTNNITIFMRSLVNLDLQRNSIKSLTSSTFSYFPNLKKVDLSENSITAWQEPVLHLYSHLEIMILKDNKIETLTDAMLKDLAKLKEVQMGANPFECDCSLQTLSFRVGKTNKLCTFRNGRYIGRKHVITVSEHLKNRVMEPKCVTFTDWPINSTVDTDMYYCYGSSGEDMIYLRDLNNTDLCLTKDAIKVEDVTNFNVVYVGIAVFLIIACILAFIYWKWWEIRLMTRAVRNAAILTFLDADDKDHPPIQYSAFVSYSDKDREWVLQNLLPRLEDWSDVNVCLHERDFQVGLSIMENITYSMERSRNLVLVLSEAFIKSQWCQFELHLAQHRLIESRRERLVLVILEPIPSFRKPKTLRYLMRTNTYLEWPGNQKPEEVDRFWNRLIKSLAGADEVV